MAAKTVAVIAGVGPGTVSSIICEFTAYDAPITSPIYTQGASIARRFAKSYTVALLARNPDTYQPIVQEISSGGGHAIGISTDVTDGKSVKNAFAEITKTFPDAPLAAAIYNVGGGFSKKPFLELSEDDFKSGFASNG